MRPGVHVGAQADPARRLARRARAGAADDADDARSPEPAMHLDAPAAQRLGDQFAGAVLGKAQLGVGVDVAADRLDLRLGGEDVIEQAHVPL
jgi:hypothetical protein